MYVKMFLCCILLFKGDDGDNGVAADSDASSASASASFASSAGAVDDDEYGDDESYGSIFSEILREGNVTYLTA